MPGWNARWPASRLQERCQLMTQRPFDRGYRQLPQSSLDCIFPNFIHNKIFFFDEDWRAVSFPDSPDYDPIHPAFVDSQWPRYTGVDLSGKKRRGNVIFTIAVSPFGVKHVLDIRMGAWESPRTAREIDSVATEFEPVVIYVENNAYQTSIIEWITELNLSCAGKIEGFRTGQNKLNEDIGLPSIDVQYSLGQWRVSIPHGEHQIGERVDGVNGCGCGLCVYVRDTKTVTFEDDTPDTVMAGFIAKEASRAGMRWTPGAMAVGRMNTASTIRKASTSKTRTLKVPVGQSTGQKKKKTDKWGRPFRKPEHIETTFDKLLLDTVKARVAALPLLETYAETEPTAGIAKVGETCAQTN